MTKTMMYKDIQDIFDKYIDEIGQFEVYETSTFGAILLKTPKKCDALISELEKHFTVKWERLEP